jgi:pyruvate dehydrogenase E1 component beta subunit
MPWTHLQADAPRSREIFQQTRSAAQRELSYRDALREAQDQALELDGRVFLIGEGIDDPGGVFGSTTGLVEKYGRQRVMDMPLAENGLTGIAAGAAMTGMRPVLIHMRVDFLPMAMDQILNHVAKWSYMTGGTVKVPLTIRAIIGRGWGSAAQHSQSLQALFAHIPGLQVVMPASPYDAKGLLLGCIASGVPSLVIEHRWLYDRLGQVPEKPYTVPAGCGAILREGNHVTLAGVSHMVIELLQAAEELAQHGINAEVLDLRSVRPLDEAILIASVRKTGRLVIADTGWRSCGLSAEVAAVVAEQAWNSLKAPVRRICVADCPTPASPVLEQLYYPGAKDIVSAASGLL